MRLESGEVSLTAEELSLITEYVRAGGDVTERGTSTVTLTLRQTRLLLEAHGPRPLDDPELAALEKITAAATPPPWRWGCWHTRYGEKEPTDLWERRTLERHPGGPGPVIRNRADEPGAPERILVRDYDGDERPEDLEFIRRSREAVPQLLALVRRLGAKEQPPWVPVHYPIQAGDQLPAERRVVLVWCGGSCLPWVGYLRYGGSCLDGPFFVVPHGNDRRAVDVIAWCDCLVKTPPAGQPDVHLAGRGLPPRTAARGVESNTDVDFGP